MKDIQLPELGLPKIIEIEPIQGCNFKCTMCHVSVMKPNNVYLDKRFLDNIGHFPEGTHVVLGTSFEPTLHPDFGEIVQNLSGKGFKISMTTNGSRFSPQLIDKIKNANFHRITFSFDSANKTSYENIRINANFDRVISRFLSFKNSLKNKDVFFSINCTVINENIDDILDTVIFAENEGFDSLGIIAAIYKINDTVLKESDFIYSDVNLYKRRVLSAIKHAIENKFNIILSSALVISENLKEIYPENVKNNLVMKDIITQEIVSINDLQLGSTGPMSVDCISPFVHVRIKNDGQVMLCNRHVIGDIYEDSLESIWYGKKADYVRKTLIENPNICFNCSYFRFCLNSKKLNYEKDSQNDRFSNYIIDTTLIK